MAIKYKREHISPLVMLLMIGLAVYIYFLYPSNSRFILGNIKGAREFEPEMREAAATPKAVAPNKALVAMPQDTQQNGTDAFPFMTPQTPLNQEQWNGVDPSKNTPLDNLQQQPVQQQQTDANAPLVGAFAKMGPTTMPGDVQVPMPAQMVAAPQVNNKAMPIKVPSKVLIEGHWIGLEVVPLTKSLAAANKISPDVRGVLVDEVTLLAAEVGILAGDVITSIDGAEIKDLKSFQDATRPLFNSTQAVVTVNRAGKSLKIQVNSADILGLAQMEAAPMISAGMPSPHGYYGPCTNCHTIVKGPVNTGQLAQDMGDPLIKTAPPIRWGAVAPHKNRGKCTECHTLI